MATYINTLPIRQRRPQTGRVAGRANFPEFFFVKEIDNSHLIRAVDVELRREYIGLVALGILVFAFFLVFSHQHLQCVRHGYQIEQYKADIAALEEQNHRLRLEQAALTDPQRIDALARRLGMVTPGQGQVINLGAGEHPEDGMENPVMARNSIPGGGDISHPQ